MMRAAPLPEADLGNPTVRRVLSEVRRRGETSRTDIAEALDLSPATVTAVSSGLITAGMVRETGAAATAGRGRPKVRLSVEPGALHVAGAKLNDGALTVAILNFAGEVLGEVSLPLPRAPISPETLAASLREGVEAAQDAAEFASGRLSAVGLGVPGYIEQDTGVCHWSPLMEKGRVALAPLLSERLGLPVHIDNDANLATLAELWFGHGRGERDFLTVTIEHGVGMGVVLGGEVFRGARGLGAEFGHIKMQNEGALCRCGQRGCLEAYVADYAMQREAGAALAQHTSGESDAAPLDRLAALAEGGDPLAAAIYQRAGRMLGLGLANLVNLFDPPLIILAGARIRHHHLLAGEMERALETNSLRTERDAPRLIVHRWGDELWARGAGSLAIDCVVSLD